jgi:hypothetical protein
VDAIEPCLDFWQKLGFETTAEVPHGDELGFVILKNGDVEVMYQTRASVSADVPALSGAPMGGTFMFIEVDDLDSIEKTLNDAEQVIPRRKTFYGSDELILREPGGNVVAFAQFG